MVLRTISCPQCTLKSPKFSNCGAVIWRNCLIPYCGQKIYLEAFCIVLSAILTIYTFHKQKLLWKFSGWLFKWAYITDPIHVFYSQSKTNIRLWQICSDSLWLSLDCGFKSAWGNIYPHQNLKIPCNCRAFHIQFITSVQSHNNICVFFAHLTCVSVTM